MDEIYKNKILKRKPFYSLTNKSVGESHKSKINKIYNILKLKKADYLFISSPENVAWLMNIRGYDSPTSPIPNSRLLINKNKEIFLIVDKKIASKIVKEKKFKRDQIINPKKFEELIFRSRNIANGMSKGVQFLMKKLLNQILELLRK